MKINDWMMITVLAGAMSFGGATVFGQEGGPGGPPGGPGNRFGRGNWGDPAQREQMLADRLKAQLEITDDAEWKALQPKIQKISDLQRQAMADRMRGFSRRPGGEREGNDQNRRGGSMFGTASPEAAALQRAIDGKASATETKAALTRYNEARKTRQAELEKAQNDLRQLLTVKQEAVLTLDGLL